MSWLGKVIGGTIGFAIGGPIGAIAGAAFGHHTIDKIDSVEYGGQRQRLSTIEETNMAFFVAAFSMLAKLSKADGHVSKEEIETIERFMAQDLHLSPESRGAAVNIFQQALESPNTFDEFASQFYQQFHTRPQILEFMLDILFRVSIADGILEQSEEELLISAARIFNFSEAQYATIKTKYIGDVDKYYGVLESNRSDSADQIKSKYRKLVSEYHPDKIASKGLPEEFNKFAHEKFREIQEAYEKVKVDKGFK